MPRWLPTLASPGHPRSPQQAQVALFGEPGQQYKCALNVPAHGRQEQFLTAAYLMRYLFGFIGKGSGNGQAVRDEILNVMHRNGIKETQGHFYEEWH